MGITHNEKAAPAVAGNDPFKSDRLAGALRKQEDTHRHRARQRIVRPTAKIGPPAVLEGQALMTDLLAQREAGTFTSIADVKAFTADLEVIADWHASIDS